MRTVQARVNAAGEHRRSFAPCRSRATVRAMADGHESTTPCPFCGTEIRAKALQCSHCRRWRHSADPPPARAAAGADAALEADAGAAQAAGVERYSRGQLPAHLVLLSVLTLGVYEFYWFYRNWRDLRDHAGLDVNPALRTIALLVPFVNIFFVYQQLRLIREIAETAGEEVFYAPGILTLVFFTVAALSNLTMIWAISLLTVFPLVPVQATLNRYWRRVEPRFPIRSELDSNEVAILFGGGILTAMAIAGSFAI